MPKPVASCTIPELLQLLAPYDIERAFFLDTLKKAREQGYLLSNKKQLRNILKEGMPTYLFYSLTMIKEHLEFFQ